MSILVSRKQGVLSCMTNHSPRMFTQLFLILLLALVSDAFLLERSPKIHRNPPNWIATSRRRRPHIDCLVLYLQDKEKVQDIGVGIDLGTTNSAVAYLKDGIPSIIPIPGNGRTMPSVVAFVGKSDAGQDEDVVVLVGQEALEQSTIVPAYSNVKRVIGTGGKLSNEVKQVVPHLIPNPNGKTYKKDTLDNQLEDAQTCPTLLRLVTISTSTNVRSDKSVSCWTTTLRPEQISSHILAKLKDVAEQHTGCRVTRAVVGVPAYFNDAQRKATLEAAKAVGIEKVKLLREPEAAALAYGIGKEQILGISKNEDELVLAFDLGGGTFDVSMLVVGGGVSEIICTSGNAKLGGADFDARIAQYMRQTLLASAGTLTKDWSTHTENAILRSAEQIRIYLSNNRVANLRLPKLEKDWISMLKPSDVLVSTFMEDHDEEKEHNESNFLNCQLTRREMERLCKDEFQALLRPVREVAIMAGALLPGDTSPTLVEAALEMEEYMLGKNDEDSLVFGDFYSENENGNQFSGMTTSDKEIIDSDTLLQLQQAALKDAKRAQQQGRRKARDLSKEERKFRAQKRKVAEVSRVTQVDGVKVRDGITGRPIARVVLVGGATRMPAVGRLIGALTGVVPQKTVNPDEAVALGCAANVGILDGVEGMGKVLSPMQAAILRAVAEQRGVLVAEEDFEDEEEFDEVEYY